MKVKKMSLTKMIQSLSMRVEVMDPNLIFLEDQEVDILPTHLRNLGPILMLHLLEVVDLMI